MRKEDEVNLEIKKIKETIGFLEEQIVILQIITNRSELSKRFAEIFLFILPYLKSRLKEIVGDDS